MIVSTSFTWSSRAQKTVSKIFYLRASSEEGFVNLLNSLTLLLYAHRAASGSCVPNS